MRINQLKIFTILFLVIVTFPLLAEHEAKVETFVKKVEGGGRVTHVIQTTDDSYVSIAKTAATIWTVRKVTPSGNKIWEKTLSFPERWIFEIHLGAIAQTNDGYVLVGYAIQDIHSSYAIVIALSSDGEVNWSQLYVVDGGNSAFHTVTSTADGGFIVTGGDYPPSNHPILVKFTSGGNIQWQKAFETLSGPFVSHSVSDNKFILAVQKSVGADLIKVDDSGNILWKRTLKIKDFSLQALGQAADNGVVIAGKLIDSGILSIIGLSSNAKIDWKATYSLKVPDFSISRVIPTADGGYVVIGVTKNKSDAARAGLFLKINAEKNLVFQKTFGVSGIQEEAQSVFATSKGGFTVFGSSGKDDLLFLSLNSDGIVPGCPYFHNLTSKTVRAGAVTVNKSSVSSQDLTLPMPLSIDVESARSSHSLSTICQ